MDVSSVLNYIIANQDNSPNVRSISITYEDGTSVTWMGLFNSERTVELHNNVGDLTQKQKESRLKCLTIR